MNNYYPPGVTVIPDDEPKDRTSKEAWEKMLKDKREELNKRNETAERIGDG